MVIRKSISWANRRLTSWFDRRPVKEQRDLADWPAILGQSQETWDNARRRTIGGPKILVATNIGGMPNVTVLETALAVALTLRGAEVHVLLCDAALPGCLRTEIKSLPDPRTVIDYRLAEVTCTGCIAKGRAAYEPLGLKIHFLGEWLTASDRQQARELANDAPLNAIPKLQFRGMNVGEHANAGALRYYARATLEGESDGEAILRRFLESALLTAMASDRLLEKEQYTAAAFHHGIYVPQGVIGEACRSRGTRVANWQAAYRRNTFIFSHEDTYHHTLLDESPDIWENMTWSEAHEAQIVGYLDSRRQGSRDWIWFHNRPDEDFRAFAESSGIDLAKPIIGMLTNVMWDAQLHYRANAFENMLTWTLETIEYFKTRPELQLVIRVHPAEIRGTIPSRQPLMAEITHAFPKLPPNVFIIRPESNLSTYAAMEQCNSVIIYGTKTGVELTSVGVPVVVAGEAWIRNKGLTIDARSKAEYFQILDSLPVNSRPTTNQMRRARKYAYHFFFRRMIPLEFIVPNEGGGSLYRVSLDRLEQLEMGRSAGLDVICSGILNGAPFVYPAEDLGLHD